MRHLLTLALTLFTMSLPAAALAGGPVHDALRADRAPLVGEALVRVVPPRGGSVMLYRDGKVAGWWLRPGTTKVRPGVAYGVMAMRGTHVLFHAGITPSPGLTELAWGDENRPRIGYVPPPPPLHAHGRAPRRHQGHASASSHAHPPSQAALVAAPNDALRLKVLKQLTKKRRLSGAEAKAAVATFRSPRYRRAAAALMRRPAPRRARAAASR